MGALADIAGGYAALTVAPEGMEVTTVEYKINFLAAFQGGELQATGRVVRGGKRIIVTTAEVVHVAPDGQRTDCAVMQQTLVPVPKTAPVGGKPLRDKEILDWAGQLVQTVLLDDYTAAR